MSEVVLSGMRPTGDSLHLGNYLGALINFVQLQEEEDKECFFFIANWHAFTTLPDPTEVRSNVLNVAADYIAAGLDPEKSTIYVQSAVPETAEIAILLSNSISHGRLTNCTTFKDKASRQQFVTAGLAFYPVLMAADILGVRARWVPVGEDQMQHLEMAREIARHFDKTFGHIFPEPQNFSMNPLRLPGLDGAEKMGKSEGNTLGLDFTPEEIWTAIATAKTDPARVRRDDPGDPGECSLFQIAAAAGTSRPDVPFELEELAEKCRLAEHGCMDCKRSLSSSFSTLIEPIRERKEALLSKPDDLLAILAEGASRARMRVGETLELMRESMHTTF